jgi:branched-chain amino acid transport system permease protein
MSGTLIAEQLLNGVQFGLMLFLIAAGLTLVFGILDILNVAHGSLYMAGAYVAAQTMQVTGSFVAAVLMAAVITGLVGLVLELVLVRKLVALAIHGCVCVGGGIGGVGRRVAGADYSHSSRHG